MSEVIYVLVDEELDGEVVVASQSKEKMIDFAVEYILDGVEEEISDEVDCWEDDEEYEEEFERIKKDYERRIRKWATDLVDGNTKHHYADEFPYSTWIYRVKLI